MADLIFARRPPGVRTVKVKRDLILIICCVFALQVPRHAVRAQGITASLKGTVSATAADASSRPELLPGAAMTLVNRDLPARPSRLFQTKAVTSRFSTCRQALTL